MLNESTQSLSNRFMRGAVASTEPSGAPSASVLALRALVATRASSTALIARVALGAVMLPHGAQKVFGWFGGYGFTGTMSFFTDTMGIPWLFALAAVLAESLGALALLLGVGTRLAAMAIGTNMVVAALTTHVQNGFFMNWAGNQQGEGFEYHILAFALALILVVLGGGIASVDARLQRYLAAATQRAGA